jgi:hypothetical protein
MAQSSTLTVGSFVSVIEKGRVAYSLEFEKSLTNSMYWEYFDKDGFKKKCEELGVWDKKFSSVSIYTLNSGEALVRITLKEEITRD